MRRALLIPSAIAAACAGFFAGLGDSAPPVPALVEKREPVFQSPAATGSNVERALVALSSTRRLEDYVRAHAALSALQAADFPVLAEVILGMHGENKKTVLLMVFRAWVKVDAAAADAWGQRLAIQLTTSGNMGGRTTLTDLVEAWAETFPESGWKYVAERWSSIGAKFVLRTILYGCKAGDMPAAVARLRTMPEGKRRLDLMGTAFYNWVEKDRASAIAGAAALPPSEERTEALKIVALNGGELAAQEAFTFAVAHGLTEPEFLGELGGAAARRKPRETAEWLAANHPALVEFAGVGLVVVWLEKELDAALQWAWDNGVVHGDGAYGRRPIRDAMQENSTRTLEWIASLPPSERRNRLIVEALASGKSREAVIPLHASLPRDDQLTTIENAAAAFGDNTQRGIEWAASLEGDGVRLAAFRAVGARAETVDEFSTGPARDALLAGFAASREAPGEALDAVAEITDPQHRRDTFEAVAWHWLKADREGQQILDDSRFPEAWKRPFTKRGK